MRPRTASGPCSRGSTQRRNRAPANPPIRGTANHSTRQWRRWPGLEQLPGDIGETLSGNRQARSPAITTIKSKVNNAPAVAIAPASRPTRARCQTHERRPRERVGQAATDQHQPTGAQQRTTGADEAEWQVQRFEPARARPAQRSSQPRVDDDIDQAAQCHRWQEDAIRDAEDPAADRGQYPQTRQQAAQNDRERAVTLKLALGAMRAASGRCRQSGRSARRDPGRHVAPRSTAATSQAWCRLAAPRSPATG